MCSDGKEAKRTTHSEKRPRQWKEATGGISKSKGGNEQTCAEHVEHHDYNAPLRKLVRCPGDLHMKQNSARRELPKPQRH